MASSNYKVKNGETLTLRLVATEGTITDVVTIECKLKLAGPRGTIPPTTTPVLATFDTISITNGWDFVLNSTATAALIPGFYVADATITLTGGEVDKTDSVLIEVMPSVS